MIYDHVRWEEKALVEAAAKKNIDLKAVNAENIYFSLHDGRRKIIGDVVLQRCIGYFRVLHLTGLLEMNGAKIVNSLHCITVGGNKLLSTIALINAGVPTPRTNVAFSIEGALKALDELGYPAFIKPTIGSWGRLVSQMKDEDAATAILEHREQMSPLYHVYYLQERVKRPPRDIRSFVIGDQVVAAIYRISTTGDWRTNTARGGRAEKCPVTKELEDLSLRAARAIGSGIFGVDLMEGENGMVVHEVNNTIEFKNTVPATGVDIPGLILDYLVSLSK